MAWCGQKVPGRGGSRAVGSVSTAHGGGEPAWGREDRRRKNGGGAPVSQRREEERREKEEGGRAGFVIFAKTQGSNCKTKFPVDLELK